MPAKSKPKKKPASTGKKRKPGWQTPGPGRTSKVLDPRVTEVFLDGIRQNLTRNLACKKAGINPGSFSRWMTRAREADVSGENDSIYVVFRNKLEKIEAETAAELVQTIETASHKDWKAAAWVVERRHPDDYGKRETTVIEGSEERPLEVKTSLDLDNLDKSVDRLIAIRQARKKNAGKK
jgi:transposase